MIPVRVATVLLLLACVPPAVAAERATTLAPVAVSGRAAGADPRGLPVILDRIDLRADDARIGVDVSGHLAALPGVLARDRRNLAQDTQLSMRGFGARTTFGVRGVRVLLDGVPATMPDGQGQLSHIALAAADRIDVLRGPFSVLHGQAAGGVLQVTSAAGEAPATLRLSSVAGRGDQQLHSLRWLDRNGALSQAFTVASLRSAGDRPHSRAERTVFNGRLTRETGPDGTLDLVLNAIDSPLAQDPLGLTDAQWRADPRQTSAQALLFDTRKTLRQQQAGLVWEQALGEAHAIRAMGYAGQRAVMQVLAVPVAAQANALNGGGVIDLDNGYGGLDLRGSWHGTLAARPLSLTLGGALHRQDQQRQGFENFVGERLGVRGALRRDERNRVQSAEWFAQAAWDFAPRAQLLLGARGDRVRFETRDRYIVGANPDDSGAVTFAQVSPVAGVSLQAAGGWRLHASLGRGFETPTFNELAYRADGGAGLALDLRPVASRQVELGAQWRGEAGQRAALALFRAESDDELVVATSIAGRSTYRNAGRVRRAGIEASAEWPLAPDWTLQLAGTWLDARFQDARPVCTPSGCAARVAAGTPLPGVARRQGFARLQWAPDDWTLAFEAVGAGPVRVSDTRAEQAPGHVLLGLEAARVWRPHGARLQGFVRIDNLTGARHVGSVIVNEGNGRFFEPGPGRGVSAGLRWTWQAGR